MYLLVSSQQLTYINYSSFILKVIFNNSENCNSYSVSIKGSKKSTKGSETGQELNQK